MKGFAITSRGIEATASMEIKELIKSDCVMEDRCVKFEFNDFAKICLLCYKSQSIDRALCLILEFKFESFFEDLKSCVSQCDFGVWIKDYKKFRVECIRLGVHDFNSVEVEKKAKELIIKKSKKRQIEFDPIEYEITFFVCIIDKKCYLGVDFAGFDLNKRGYKVFTHANSLRGTIAYSLIREGGFEKNETMLDPFSREGIIPIESALYCSGISVNYYRKDKFAFLKLNLGINFERFFAEADKSMKNKEIEVNCFDHLFKFVDYSKKNAKVAGVDKLIKFSRVELEWLDLKFKKSSVNRIITVPPSSNSSSLERIYNEFFYQSKYILKKDGSISLISRLPELLKRHAERHGFAVEKEKEVWSGQQQLKIMVLKNR